MNIVLLIISSSNLQASKAGTLIMSSMPPRQGIGILDGAKPMGIIESTGPPQVPLLRQLL